jgi:hypothetical protein
LAFLLLGTFWLGNAQNTLRPDTAKKEVAFRTDTIKASYDSLLSFKQSPTKAALMSAVFPGLGQIYNKKYWKLPLVYAGFGISAYYLIKNQRSYKKYLDGFVVYSNTNRLSSVQEEYFNFREGVDVKATLQNGMNTYRRWRDWSIFSLSLVYFLNIVDATVDAYFFTYDISDDLALQLRPAIINTEALNGALGLKLSINLH